MRTLENFFTSENSIFGKLPLEWEIITIKDLELGEKAVQTGPFGSLLHAYDYAEEGVPLLLVRNIENGQIDTSNIPKVNFKKAEDLKKFWIKEGDIIITRVGAVGRTVYITKDYTNWMFSGQTLRIRINNPKINNRYLELFFRTSNFQKYIENHMLGTTRPSLNTSIIENIPISLPDRNIQDSIVRIIGNIEGKIRLNEQMNSTLESLAESLFYSWFVFFDPFLDGDFVDSELGRIPKGWRVGELKDVLALIYGKGLPKNKRELGNIPVYGSNGITGYHDEFYVDHQTIVVGRKGTVGALTLTYGSSWPIDTTYFVEPKNNANIFFIYLLLQTLNLETMNTHSAVPGLNRELVYALRVIIPPKEIIEEQGLVFISIYDKIKTNLNEISFLSSLHDLLLPQLFSGKLRIKHPVQFLEELEQFN